jgi:archaellum biogenesis ATPase FlaH
MAVGPRQGCPTAYNLGDIRLNDYTICEPIDRRDGSDTADDTETPSRWQSPAPTPQTKPCSRFFSTYELIGLPDPEWQVDGVIPKGAIVVIYGSPGDGKSFVAQDLAHRIGEGLPWFGHRVERGQVVYESAEGNAFIKLRAMAWLMAHIDDGADPEAPNVFYFLDSVQMLSDVSIDNLLQIILERNVSPEFIVIDTLARNFVGGEENSAKDMGTFVSGLEQLRAGLKRSDSDTGPTICVVHHTGKDNKQERGTTALRGAADVMIKVTMNAGGIITVENDKQKDGPEFPPLRLRLNECQVGSAKNGEPLLSCAVVPAGDADGPKGTTANGLTPKQRNLLAILSKQPKQTIKTGDWIKISDLDRRDFHNQREKLMELGMIDQPKRGHYKVTKTGEKLLTPGKVKVKTK